MRSGSREFQASSASCTFCRAVSSVKGGSGGRTFLAAVLDYSPTASGFDAAGHTLFPYAPQAGFLLGGFTLCMLVSTGLWGAVARIASREFMVRAAILTGLLLFGAVAGIGYALSPDQRHTSAPHSGFPVAQGGVSRICAAI